MTEEQELDQSYLAEYARNPDGRILLSSADASFGRWYHGDILRQQENRIRSYFNNLRQEDGVYYFEILEEGEQQYLWLVNGLRSGDTLTLRGTFVRRIRHIDFLEEGFLRLVSGVGVADCRKECWIGENDLLKELFDRGSFSGKDLLETTVCRLARSRRSAVCGEPVCGSDGKQGGYYFLLCIPVLQKEETAYLLVLVNRFPWETSCLSEIVAPLTKREREIVSLVSEGMTNKYIAGRLGISEGTVKKNLYHCYRKLHINSRFDMIRLFYGSADRIAQDESTNYGGIAWM